MIEQCAEMPTYVAYKDSGVEWLGEIPAHWKSQKLKFNSELRVSNVDKHSKKLELPVKLANYVDVYKNNFITDSIEFMEVTANQEEIERFSIQIDDVLITKDSEDWLDIGVPALVKYQERNLLCGYHLAIIRSKYNAEGKFVFWALLAHYNRIQFSLKASGVTRFGISHGAIKNNWLALPPLPEQTLIAAFLDHKTAQIDQSVVIKEQQIALLKERKQILIQNAVTRGLDSNVPMRDSGVEWIGEIPAHWKLFRVKNVFRLVIESAEKNNDYELLSIYTDIGVKPRKELEEKGNKASTTDGYWLVKKGDFIVNKLLAWMGAIGLSEYEGVTSPAYDILRPIKPIDGYFYHYLFRTKSCTSELKKHSRGIMEMRLRLYFDKFGNVLIPYPSQEEQTAIVTHIETQSAKIDQAIAIQQQQIDKLKEYKATLINSAVTGKIRVPEVAA